MEVIEGATPKGLEEAGVGETPLLEMVLPGVTAIAGAGDEPEGQRSQLDDAEKTLHKKSLHICLHSTFNIYLNIFIF